MADLVALTDEALVQLGFELMYAEDEEERVAVFEEVVERWAPPDVVRADVWREFGGDAREIEPILVKMERRAMQRSFRDALS